MTAVISPKDIAQSTPFDYSMQTNASISNEDNPSFTFSSQVYQDADGTHISVPSSEKAIILSSSLRDLHANGEHHQPVVYLTKDEVQSAGESGKIGELKLPDSYRMIRIMPILQIRQNGSLSIPLSYRGPGAANRDHWGCASSLASKTIDSASIYSTLNRESGILINGKPAIFAPDKVQNLSDLNCITDDALRIKRGLAPKVPQLSHAFKGGAEPVVIKTTMGFENKETSVDFHGGVLRGSLDAIVHDDIKTRTLTLIFPVVANLPDNAQVVVFNGEGYRGPITLATREDLVVARKGMKLIPGLWQFVHGA